MASFIVYNMRVTHNVRVIHENKKQKFIEI
jgi:hypothetical protein